MKTGRCHPGDYPIGESWNGEDRGRATAPAKAREIERVDLVPDGDAFRQWDHVETGNDQPVDQDEGDAIASNSPAASAVEHASIHGSESAFQPGNRREAEITKQFREHQKGESAVKVIALEIKKDLEAALA